MAVAAPSPLQAVGAGVHAVNDSTFPDARQLWRELVEGRLAVVRQHDFEGRRYLTLRSLPSTQQGRLTERERMAALRRARGQPLKRIALELHVSVPTVARELARARSKLGLSTDLELPALFALPATVSRRG
jgi:DNA-binding CsgD family transcriptional regulator